MRNVSENGSKSRQYLFFFDTPTTSHVGSIFKLNTTNFSQFSPFQSTCGLDATSDFIFFPIANRKKLNFSFLAHVRVGNHSRTRRQRVPTGTRTYNVIHYIRNFSPRTPSILDYRNSLLVAVHHFSTNLVAVQREKNISPFAKTRKKKTSREKTRHRK